MKRNLYYYIGLLSGLFLIACSDQIGDSEPSIGQGQDEGTYLFIQVGNSLQGGQTKTISSVCVLVFNEKNILETIGTSTTLEDEVQNASESLRAFSVSPGKKKIILVANVGETFINGTNGYTHSVFKEGQELDEVLNLTKEYEDIDAGSEIGDTDPLQENCHLSLNSGVYDVDILPGMVNCLGMTDEKMNSASIIDAALQPVTSIRHNLDTSSSVSLYFNTALVQSEIVVDADEKVYPNARLEERRIFVLNAKNKTKLVGKDGKAWGTTFVAENSLSGIEDAKVLSSTEEFYLYENTNINDPTLLVVQGNFTYDNPDVEGGRLSINDCYYVVKIGVGLDYSNLALPVGNREQEQIQGLLRNVRYNIKMTITQPYTDSPLDVLTKSGSNNSACVAETEVTAM